MKISEIKNAEVKHTKTFELIVPLGYPKQKILFQVIESFLHHIMTTYSRMLKPNH